MRHSRVAAGCLLLGGLVCGAAELRVPLGAAGHVRVPAD